MVPKAYSWDSFASISPSRRTPGRLKKRYYIRHREFLHTDPIALLPSFIHPGVAHSHLCSMLRLCQGGSVLFHAALSMPQTRCSLPHRWFSCFYYIRKTLLNHLLNFLHPSSCYATPPALPLPPTLLRPLCMLRTCVATRRRPGLWQVWATTTGTTSTASVAKRNLADRMDSSY